MKKYKLIKKYPGSPELGTIAEKSGDIKYILPNGEEFFESSANENLFKKLIENQPEFWEEVIEKDYEILSLISTNVDKTIITYKNGGCTYKTNFFPEVYKSVDYWVKCFTMNNNPWKINSVKRLSDNVVFKIGDYIQEGRIINISIKNFKIYLYIN